MTHRRYQRPGTYPPAHPMALREYLRRQGALEAAIERVMKIMSAKIHRWADVSARVNGVDVNRVNSITWINSRIIGDVMHAGVDVQYDGAIPYVTTTVEFK